MRGSGSPSQAVDFKGASVVMAGCYSATCRRISDDGAPLLAKIPAHRNSSHVMIQHLNASQVIGSVSGIYSDQGHLLVSKLLSMQGLRRPIPFSELGIANRGKEIQRFRILQRLTD